MAGGGEDIDLDFARISHNPHSDVSGAFGIIYQRCAEAEGRKRQGGGGGCGCGGVGGSVGGSVGRQDYLLTGY